MGKFYILIFFVSTTCFAQSVELNPDTKIYEVVIIDSLNTSPEDRLESFKKQMTALSYEAINAGENSLSGQSYFTKKIYGSAMEVHYNTVIDFKDNRYRITFNKFYVNDVRYGQYTFEDMKKSNRKRWIDLVNEKIPEIISQLKYIDNW